MTSLRHILTKSALPLSVFGVLAGLGQAAQAAAPAKAREALIQRLDRNGDHKLQVDEVSAELSRLVAQFDRDGDKSLSPDELRAAAGTLREHVEQLVEQRREARRGRVQADVAALLERSVPVDGVEMAIASLDRDGDGQISVRETVAAARTAADVAEQRVHDRLQAACQNLRAGRLPWQD